MIEIIRNLEEGDFALLEEERGVKSPTLRRLTDMHHTIARLVSQGESGYGISMATGYSESRISILKSDPAFQELVAFYREKVVDIRDAAFADLVKKGAAVYSDILDKIHEKVLDTDPEMRDLVDAGKFVADRSGFGPASKSLNAHVDLTNLADTLAAGRQRAVELSAAVPAAQAGRSVVPTPLRPVGGRDD